jgi:hypothetical protein
VVVLYSGYYGSHGVQIAVEKRMMYVYFDIEENEWYLSKSKQTWYWYDKDGGEHDMVLDFPSSNLEIPVDVAERWVWGRMNIPGFEVYVMTGLFEDVRGWVFEIENEEDAMHYKLRWSIE